MSAADIIRRLDLQPHPEGGWYRETFRDTQTVEGRSRSTAIVYLLEADQRSHWHRIDAVETWHFYKGSPLSLRTAPPEGTVDTAILGVRLDRGERPQLVVPQGWWQSAHSLGAYTLAGCTVAPGFEFSGFDLAPLDFWPT